MTYFGQTFKRFLLLQGLCLIALLSQAATVVAQQAADLENNMRRLSAMLAEKRAEDLSPEALTERLAAVQSANREVLHQQVLAAQNMYGFGKITLDEVLRAQMALNNADPERVNTPAEKIRLLREQADSSRQIESAAETLAEVGVGKLGAFPAARARRIDAELRLAREVAAQQQRGESPASQPSNAPEKVPLERMSALMLAQRIQELSISKRDALLKCSELFNESYEHGTVPLETLLSTQDELLEAELALTADFDQRIQLLRKRVESATRIEDGVRDLQAKGGKGGSAGAMAAASACQRAANLRLAREVLLKRAGQQREPAKPPSENHPATDLEMLSTPAITAQIETLKKELRDLLRRQYEVVQAEYETGTAHLDVVLRVLDEFINADLELAQTAADRIRLQRERVGQAIKWEQHVFAKSAVGAAGGDTGSILSTHGCRLAAEIKLVRELLARPAADVKPTGLCADVVCEPACEPQTRLHFCFPTVKRTAHAQRGLRHPPRGNFARRSGR